VNGLLIISGAAAFVPLLAIILIAVLPSFIDLTLYKTSKSAATLKADAVLLELGLVSWLAKPAETALSGHPDGHPYVRC
jgi:hypothetical protein